MNYLRKSIVVSILLLLSSTAQSDHHFVDTFKLTNGKTVAITEGELEPRSIGSFTVRLFAEAAPAFETTYFLSGLLHERDGVIERVVLEDINGDLLEEIIVIVRSVGSGSYLSAHAFQAREDELIYIQSVEDLQKDADAVSLLRGPVE